MAVILYYDSELTHHGIKGQKWGVRNGPPYPLNSDQKSVSETASGDLITYLAVLAVDKIATTAVEKGKTYMYEKHGEDIYRKGLKKQDKPESIEETVKKVNPLKGTQKGLNNCTACSVATELRRRGYDVVAKGTGGEGRVITDVVKNAFNCPKGRVKVRTLGDAWDSKESISKAIANTVGNNARGIITVIWDSQYGGSGHAFNFEISNGTVNFFDGQLGITDKKIMKTCAKEVARNKGSCIIRLDDLKVNVDGVSDYAYNKI